MNETIPAEEAMGEVSIEEALLTIGKQMMRLRPRARIALRPFTKGIAVCVDEIGMWHQVLTRRESYAETSCSAMFTLAIARGVRCGWLGKEYRKLAENGWRALMQHCVDKQGNTYGICLGSGCQMEEEYYFTIPTHKNDDHGTGILLAAGCEVLKMRQWQTEQHHKKS